MTSIDNEFDEQYDRNIPYYLKGVGILKDRLYKEYTGLTKKPNFGLYLTHHNIDGINDYRRVDEKEKEKIATDFDNRVSANTLPSECFAADILETDTFKIIKDIDDLLGVFSDAVFDVNTDKYKEPELRAAGINTLLQSLNDAGIYNALLESITSKYNNVTLIIDSIPDFETPPNQHIDYKTLWGGMWENFKTHLKVNSNAVNEATPQQQQSNTEQPHISNRFVSNKIIQESHVSYTRLSLQKTDR